MPKCPSCGVGLISNGTDSRQEWTEKRLDIIEITQDSEPYWQIFNKKKEYLGELIKKRVGAWEQWVFCPDLDDDMAIGDLWFTARCMDEIREKMRELNGKRTKAK